MRDAERIGKGRSGHAHVAVLATLAALLTAAATAEAKTYTYTSRQEIPLANQVAFSVENHAGDITILPAERNAISLEVVKRIHARNVNEANHVARQIAVQRGRTEDSMAIRVRYPGLTYRFGPLSFFSLRFLSRDVSLRLLVPPTMRVSISTASGDVMVRDMRNTVNLHGVSGDAELSRLNGRVVCRMTSGDLVIREVAGPVDVRSVSGDVRIADAAKRVSVRTSSGDVSGNGLKGGAEITTVSGGIRVGTAGAVVLKTSSGDVTVRDATGGAMARTVSGTIAMTVRPRPDDAVEVHSTSGDVTLRLPSQTGADLDLSTVSGQMVTRLPLTLRTAARRTLTARMGRGGVPVTVQTVSGSIRVLPLGARTPGGEDGDESDQSDDVEVNYHDDDAVRIRVHDRVSDAVAIRVRERVKDAVTIRMRDRVRIEL